MNIDSSSSKAAFDIKDNAEVNLTLNNTNTLTSGGVRAGLHVSRDAKLTIGGVGSIDVTGAEYGAGIGGNGGMGADSGDFSSSGIIIINSGTIVATGKQGGAGIGGGFAGVGGTITINGGTVIATGSKGGAGIGGGKHAEIKSENAGESTITIDGGIVTATGGERGSGIGSGFCKEGGAIAIKDGTVVAAGIFGKAGISGNVVTIDNSATVKAASDNSVPAIKDDDTITASEGNTAAIILMATYRSGASKNTETEVKAVDGQALDPSVTFTPTIAYNVIALTVPSKGEYTLYKGGKQQCHSWPSSKTFTVSNTGINNFTKVSDASYTAL